VKKLRFVVSLITDDNDYQRQQASAAQEAATRLGVELQTLFARNDPIHESQQLLDIFRLAMLASTASLWNPPVEPRSPRWHGQRSRRAWHG
jgi:hypothetical protein